MLRIFGCKCFRARVAGSINALHHIGLLTLLALALGISFGVAQEGQLVPKTRVSKAAPAAPAPPLLPLRPLAPQRLALRQPKEKGRHG